MTRQALKDIALSAVVAGVAGFVAVLTTGDVTKAVYAGLGAFALVVAKALNPADGSYGVGAGK